MKKYKILCIICIIVTVFIGSFLIYKVVASKKDDDDIYNKTFAEVQHIDSKLTEIFNKMNNINMENFELVEEKIEDNNSNNSSSSQDSQASSGGQQSNNSDNSNGDSSNKNSSKSQEDNKKYTLKETGVLTSSADINWDVVKNEVEKLYPSIYPATLDLYKVGVGQEQIVSFNSEFDNLTIAVKDEDKEKTLEELSKIYNYLPGFLEKCTNEEKEKVVINTKNQILKAYSLLEKEDWNGILDNINNASKTFTTLVTSTENKEQNNQYNINKTYIMINELKNAAELKDKDVFLIKYKNLLEELQNI